MRILRCSNCRSVRRSVHRSGYCKKCSHWALLLRKGQRLSEMGIVDNRYSAYKIKRAEKVLNEYKWRETPFVEQSIDPLQLEYSIRAIARLVGSRSKYPIHGVAAVIQESHRLLLYEMILEMIETRSNRSPIFILPQ